MLSHKLHVQTERCVANACLTLFRQQNADIFNTLILY